MKKKEKEMTIDVKIETPEGFKLSEKEVLPNYSTPNSAGMDLKAVNLKEIYSGTKKIHQEIIGKAAVRNFFVLRKGERALIGTGLKMAIPEGYELQIRSRSGLALKKGLIIANSPGCIDPDYRAEICVIILNTTEFPMRIYFGDKVAQAMLIAVTKVTSWNVVEELDETERGEGGFGSTGE